MIQVSWKTCDELVKRYKKRNEELEDQQSEQMQQLNLLQSEIKDLQTDNVKLYEKIRYLQGYQV